MTLWEGVGERGLPGRVLGAVASVRALDIRRDAPLQWLVAVATGMGLGLLVLAANYQLARWAPFLMLVALFPFVAMIVGDVRKLLLGVILLDTSFRWDFHPTYDDASGRLGAIAGPEISVTAIALVGLYLLWMAELLTGKEDAPRPRLAASLPLGLYVAWVAASALFAMDASFALYEAVLLLPTFLLFLYVASTVRTRQDLLFVVTVLVIGLALESLIMIAVQFMGPGLNIPGITTRLDPRSMPTNGPFRAIGTFGSPNVASSYLSLLLAPALALLMARVRDSHKLLALTALALGGLALTVTFSRGGWGAFAISIGIVWLFAWRRGWASIAVPLVVLGAAVVLFVNFSEPILARINDLEAAESRIPLTALALRMVVDNLWTGVGANNFYVALPAYLTPEFANVWLFVVHNKYLLVWSETGSIGLLAYLVFLVATLRRGWQGWSLNDRFLSMLALGLTAGVMGQMFHMFFDIFNNRAQVQGLWVVAALVTAIVYLGEGEKERWRHGSGDGGGRTEIGR